MTLMESAQLLGNVGEFIGGVVVIVTVVYLALQLRNANRQAAAAAEISWTQGLNEIWDRWSRPDVRDAVRAGMEDFLSLDRDSQVIFHMHVGSLVNQLETAKRLVEAGLLPQSFGETTENVMTMILGTKGGLQYWELDSQATPDGGERHRLIRTEGRSVPAWNSLFPWWRSNDCR